MRLVRRPWIWLLRFRHRRGYGVHSPYAYAFLRDVVYEDMTYYAYASLNHLHPWWVRMTRAYPLCCRRLLFRLANFIHPSTMSILGDCPIEHAYFSAAVPSARWIAYDADSPSIPDLLFVAADSLPSLSLSHQPSRLMLIAEGIHHDEPSRQVWQRIKGAPATVLTFDLYDYGIALFSLPLTPQHYIVNF